MFTKITASQFGDSYLPNGGHGGLEYYDINSQNLLKILIEQPTPLLKDKSIDIETWNVDINRYFLSILASLSNKYMVPTVK